jgi:3-isopropylmalate dehydratase
MPSAETKPRTLYDKVFDDHIVNQQDDGTCLLYIGMQAEFPTSCPQFR